VRRGLFASFLAGETRPAVRDAGFLDAAAREAARGAGLLDVAAGWCATVGFRGVVLFDNCSTQAALQYFSKAGA
jgi:hypothetical protein